MDAAEVKDDAIIVPKGGERELQKPSWLGAQTTNVSLDDGDKSEFNQFQGRGPSTYNDSLYTSNLDMSKITKAQMQKAQEVEATIGAQDSTNRHVLEERGLAHLSERDETGLYQNEEMKYSGVVRSIGKFKTFHPNPTKNGLKRMTESFLKQPANNQAFIAEKSTAIIPVAKPAPVKESKPFVPAPVKPAPKEFKEFVPAPPKEVKEFVPSKPAPPFVPSKTEAKEFVPAPSSFKVGSSAFNPMASKPFTPQQPQFAPPSYPQ